MFTKTKILITDVDGVLTHGHIIYDNQGNELKRFSVKDGLGLHLLHKAGYKTAIITGRKSEIVEHRAKELHITRLYQGIMDKLNVFHTLLNDFSLSPDETCYIGDDLLDIPVIRASGVGIAVADAVQEVRDVADYICQSPGGEGAIREICELIIKRQGKWDDLIENIIGK